MRLEQRVARLEDHQKTQERCPPGACLLPPIPLLEERPDGSLIDEDGRPAPLPSPTCSRCGQGATGITVIITRMPDTAA